MTREFRPDPVRRPGQKPKAGLASSLEDTARVQVLGGDALQLQDEADAALAAGYDPYDTYPPVRQAQSTQKHADLRKLSESIRARRAAEQAARQPADGDDPPKGLKRFLRSLR